MSSKKLSLNTDLIPDKPCFFENFASGPSFGGGPAEYTCTSWVRVYTAYVEAGVLFFLSLIIELVEIWLTLWYVKYVFYQLRQETFGEDKLQFAQHWVRWEIWTWSEGKHDVG